MVDYSVMFGGKAGEGIKQAANFFGKLMQEFGYYVFIYDDYPSVIRGSHNFSIVRFSDKKIKTTYSKADVIVAIDERTYKTHKNDLFDKGLFYYDDMFKIDKNAVALPLTKVVAKNKGLLIMKNSGAIAAVAKHFGIDWKFFEKIFKKEFKKQTSLNLKIAKEIYNLVETKVKLKKGKAKILPLFTGNEATGLGAVKAGLDIYYAYPMTPSTGILHYLANNREKFKIEVIQPENEISVVNMALGSAYAGARTMVGTSGGGFALMNETLSLAAISETPLTVVISQRTGPATGVPTYTAQSELNYVINAAHGEFSRVVLAPGDAEECYYYTGLALNLAWKYQIPTFVLTDKHVSESTFSFDEKEYKVKEEKPLLWNGKGKYERYAFTKNGISPLAFPSGKATVKASSYEHDAYGITVEDAESVKKMVEKRLRKAKLLEKEIKKEKMFKLYGKDSKVVVLAWGSTKGVVEEVAKKLKVRFIQPIILEPFPDLKKYLKDKKIVVVETNTLGQLAKLLEANGFKVYKKILKYDGRPFFLDELEKELKKVL